MLFKRKLAWFTTGPPENNTKIAKHASQEDISSVSQEDKSRHHKTTETPDAILHTVTPSVEKVRVWDQKASAEGFIERMDLKGRPTPEGMRSYEPNPWWRENPNAIPIFVSLFDLRDAEEATFKALREKLKESMSVLAENNTLREQEAKLEAELKSVTKKLDQGKNAWLSKWEQASELQRYWSEYREIIKRQGHVEPRPELGVLIDEIGDIAGSKLNL
ncbi:hypothetical protein K445DRAFT_16245 [Daldinia sp. EC12]|nr:hypothetical protein K445DRAFT_16245 [Daldinia sp. EC12]